MAFSAPEPGDARRDADADLTVPDPAAATPTTATPTTATPTPVTPTPVTPPAAGPVTAGPVPAGPLSSGPVVPEQPRNPLLAALGAGDAAVAAVARAFADAFSAATARQRTVQQRVTDLPAELEGLRGRFPSEELRRALESYRVQVERVYAEFAGRGEETWERLREQPHVRQAITTLESYTGKLDARVDELVEEAQEAAARAGAAVGRRSRAAGEQVAEAGERVSGRAAETVADASVAAADAVEDAGTGTAGAIEDAGGETAAITRGTSRSAARAATPRRTPRPEGPASE
jgi:heparin binding hemagglutinin HbhA